MSKVVVFQNVHPAAAGVDIGAEKIFVSMDGQTITSYQTFTRDYKRCCRDLKENKIERVAMEATGIYWIALYDILTEAGIEVCLVNPKETRSVKGRKSDCKDCCWIQKLYSAGLLHQSYIPAGAIKEMRMVVRERQDIIEMGSTYVNKMQKCLELMNIKLTNVLSQIHGVSGMRIIEAIISGERDPQKLLLLCEKKIIINKSEQVIKALEGNYNETWVFLLNQNMRMWQQHQQQISILDNRIAQILKQMSNGKEQVSSDFKPKLIRHHKPEIKDLHARLLSIYGVELNCLPGINDYTLLRLLGEVGQDMSRFPTQKHFTSWCGLAPGLNKSGKINKRSKIRNGSKAGQIFREAAQSVISSKHLAIGAFMRRIRSKKGPAIAIKAGARKIAAALYCLLTEGSAYVEQGIKKYEEQLKQRELKNLKSLALKHKMQLVEC